MLYRADENGIIFSTGYDKDVHKQLIQNPQVELCFLNQETNMQVRIEGSVEVLEDLELKKQIVADFPFLKEWIDSEGYDVLITYSIKDARATIWTMETNFQPKQYIQLWSAKSAIELGQLSRNDYLVLNENRKQNENG